MCKIKQAGTRLHPIYNARHGMVLRVEDTLNDMMLVCYMLVFLFYYVILYVC